MCVTHDGSDSRISVGQDGEWAQGSWVYGGNLVDDCILCTSKDMAKMDLSSSSEVGIFGARVYL